jgi:hypothetical protein
MTEDTSNDALLADELVPAADNEHPSDADTSDLDSEAGETADETTTDAEPDADKADGEDEDEDGEPEKPKKKLSGSERLKRRLAAQEAELAELRAARSQPQGNGGDALEQAVRAELEPEPKEADYQGDYLAFESDRQAWKAARLALIPQIRREMAAREARAADARFEVLADHQDRIDDLAKAVPGLKDKLAKAAAEQKVPPHIAERVLRSPKSAELAVHFADNPKVMAELGRMAPADALFELGQITARLSRPTPKATKAPPPSAPLKGRASVPNPSAQIDAWIARTYGR